MGNKQIKSETTEVVIKPKCVHRGCTHGAYSGFVLCLDHIKESKRKQLEEEEVISNTKKNGTVSKHP